MSDKDLPKTYTVEEIQRILHYKSPESVRRLIKNGRIPAIRVGGKYLVTEETLQKILKGEISADDEWPAINLTLVKHSPVTFQPHYWFGVRHPIQKILGYSNNTLLAAETAMQALLLQLDEMKALARAKFTMAMKREERKRWRHEYT